MGRKKWLAAQKIWLAERKISSKYWRCAKCLVKHYIAEDGWECAQCELSCEPDRIKARQVLKVGDDDSQHSSDASCGKDLDGTDYNSDSVAETKASSVLVEGSPPNSHAIYSSVSRADAEFHPGPFRPRLSGLGPPTSKIMASNPAGYTESNLRFVKSEGCQSPSMRSPNEEMMRWQHSHVPKKNVYTECGRHSDEWLFGGWSDKVKKLWEKNK
jgi:hypothetical protein